MNAIKRSLVALAVASLLSGSLQAQSIVVTSPPPGSQTPIPSALVNGFVVDPLESVDEVFFRTRYNDGSLCPPIEKDGGTTPGSLGWGYAVTWNGAGLGTFEGRVKWLKSGTNFLDIYLPTDTLGSPNYSQSIVLQLAGVQPTDIVGNVHPVQRTIDVTDTLGADGEFAFRVDLINTTAAQSYTVDLTAKVTMPSGAIVDLPMGGPGQLKATYTIVPGDFSYTSVLDQAGMTFSFPLTQAPFPQPVQQGLYHMEVFVKSGPALIWFDEDVDFEVTDRTGKPFRDVTALAGLKDIAFQGGNRPAAGTCMAVFDYDGDGLTDMFFSNPAADETFLVIGSNWPFPGGHNYLMKNNGDGTFSDVTAVAGVTGDMTKASYGVCWGDLDSDGDLDLFVTNRKRQPFMYRNNGDGTFTDVAQGSFGNPHTEWWMAPRFGDIDADGDLDLYVGKYMKTFSTTWELTGWVNDMYRNELVEGILDPLAPGFPMFTKINATSGTNSVGVTLGSFFFDSNRDGHLDLAVHNDFGAFSVPNQLYEGDGTGAFTDTSAARGYDVGEFSMGAAAGDFNGDGFLDVYSTSIGRNSMLMGDGAGNYTQGVLGSGAEGDFLTQGPQADGLNLNDNWGAMVWDYDLDMDTDLYVVGADLFTTFNMPIAEVHPDSVFGNDGTGSFTEEATNLGLNNGARGRGAALLDIDQDGDMDVVVPAENEGATLFRNDQVTSNHYLNLRPVTHRSAPGGFNTFFEVTAGGVTQVHELMAENAHASQGDNAYTFGLGANTSAQVTAHWQRGGSTTIFSQPADLTKEIHETVLEINGEIHGSVPETTFANLRLLGPPGAVGIATMNDPSIPFAFPLPSGGTLDIWPNFSFLKVAFLDGAGSAPWTLGPVPVGYVGASFQFQMVTLNPFTFIYDSKSGVSTLTVVP